jgi:pyruvate,orthophosphate dikinase
MAVDKGRSVKPKLKVGICGEHGGDPHTIELCHRTGLDYVSCSPFRLPIARLAAAQAFLINGKPASLKNRKRTIKASRKKAGKKHRK